MGPSLQACISYMSMDPRWTPGEGKQGNHHCFSMMFLPYIIQLNLASSQISGGLADTTGQRKEKKKRKIQMPADYQSPLRMGTIDW